MFGQCYSLFAFTVWHWELLSSTCISAQVHFCFLGHLELPEVAKLFDKSTLLQLKNECGGLQTLLRNHYYIFKGALNLDTLTIVLIIV